MVIKKGENSYVENFGFVSAKILPRNRFICLRKRGKKRKKATSRYFFFVWFGSFAGKFR